MLSGEKATRCDQEMIVDLDIENNIVGVEIVLWKEFWGLDFSDLKPSEDDYEQSAK